MSSCLILQTKKDVFIGSDSASSTNYNGKFYRVSNNFSKIHIIKNSLVFLAGNKNDVEKVLLFLKKRSDFSDSAITQHLQNNICYSDYEKIYRIELIICCLVNGKSVVKQFSEYNNYNVIYHTVNDDSVKIITAGIKSMACCDSAENILKSTCNVKHIYQYVFNSISCNEIGGILSVFQLYTMRKIYEQHILENNIEYMHENIRQGLLIADVVVGRLVASNNLTVTNENNQFLLNDQGAYLNNASMVFTRGNNSITIDPNVGLSFKRGSEEVIKMDLQTGNGIFSGEIRGGSININNRFRVDANGNATMEYADIRGGEIRLGNTIITEDDFRSRNAYFEDSIMDDSCEYWGEIDGSQITRDSINANRIMAGSITANEISTSYMRAIRIDGDQIRANSITADQIDASFIDAIEIRAESIISGTLYGMDIEWPGGSLRLGVGSDGINRTTVVWLKSQYTVGIKISSGAGLSLEAENGIWISGWDKDLERTLMEFDSRLTSLEWRV